MQSITLFAMTERGYAVAEALLTGHPGLVAAVVCSRDEGIARDHYQEIEALCLSHKVPFHNKSVAYPITTSHALAVAWRWLISTGPARLIVMHDSLLPRYRGFNPLVSSLINGDTEIGVTSLYAASDYDRGDIIGQSSSVIEYPIRIQEAIRITIANYQALAMSLAGALVSGQEPTSQPQDESAASYSLWRDEEDYFVDWSLSAETIKRTVDALGYPFKGAAATLNGRTARILDSEALDDVRIENRTAGKVIFSQAAGPVVVCGQGLLRITKLVDDETGASLLPLSRFRLRFKGFAR